MLSALAGIGAVITGLLLAAAPATNPPVIAVAAVPAVKSLPGPLRVIVADARAHHARLLLLVAQTPKLAAAATDALDGYVRPAPVQPKPPLAAATVSPTAPPVTPAISGPPDFAVIYSRGGSPAVIGQLPASVDVLLIRASGDSLRSAVNPGGHGLLVLLFGCLLVSFGYLVTRTATLLRPPPLAGRAAAYPAAEAREVVAPAGAPARLAQTDDRSQDVPGPADEERLRVGYRILASHRPRAAGGGWQPQCPWCGSFAVRATAAAAAGHDRACLDCEHRWPAANPELWPDTVVSHRRRHVIAEAAEPDNQT